MSEEPAKGQDEKARHILTGAAKIFSDKGYHHASMRDISRETGISLAGMYYYFSSKEEMLYSIQKYCFRQVMEQLNERLQGVDDPQEKLRVFIRSHLDFFTENVREMKVLSHEFESLTGEHLDEVQALRRDYFHALTEILRELPGRDWPEQEVRHVGLSIFGMVNWIYTWYDPTRDGSAEQLTETMGDLLWTGLLRA